MHGRGIGAAILEWAMSEVRHRGRQCLRLDCLAGNAHLRRYYEEQGFILQGRVADRDYAAALYEKSDE